MKHIDIINACTDLGVHVNGAHLGPIELTKNLTHSSINEIFTLQYGNVVKELEKNNKRKNIDELNKFNEKLYNLVSSSLNNEKLPLTIGGDHSLAIASALASIKKHSNLGIIWFDSHGDYNTFDTTISGNIHGLPLAVITNYEKRDLAFFHSGNFYNPQNTVIVGGRDIDDPLEIENLKEAGVTVFSTEDVKTKGADVITRKAFEIASKNTNGVHVSFDIDLIDPEVAPGVSIPAVDGIDQNAAYLMVDTIIKKKNLVKSIDLVEYNPTLDVDNKTKIIALNILNKFLNNFYCFIYF